MQSTYTTQLARLGEIGAVAPQTGDNVRLGHLAAITAAADLHDEGDRGVADLADKLIEIMAWRIAAGAPAWPDSKFASDENVDARFRIIEALAWADRCWVGNRLAAYRGFLNTALWVVCEEADRRGVTLPGPTTPQAA